MVVTLGAGVFLTTIVVGAVSLCGSFHLMERPFLRDVIFFIVAVFCAFYISQDHKVTLAESFGMYSVVDILNAFTGFFYRKNRSS